jgi:hypothetical protein
VCSLHTRIAKKFSTEFQTLRDAVQTDVSDDAIFRVKLFKQKAADECLMLTGCAAAEKYLKVLRSPTPPKRNLMMVQQHLDELLKQIK